MIFDNAFLNPSEERKVDEDLPKPLCSMTQVTAKLLGGSPVSLQLSPFKDVRSQLSDLRRCQDEFFRQLIDQQNTLQNQLLEMHSTSRSIEQRQEDLIEQFREFTSKSRISKQRISKQRISKQRLVEILAGGGNQTDVIEADEKVNNAQNAQPAMVGLESSQNKCNAQNMQPAMVGLESSQHKTAKIAEDSATASQSTASSPLSSHKLRSSRRSDKGQRSSLIEKKSKAALKRIRMQRTMSAGFGNKSSLKYRVEKFLRSYEFEIGIASAIMVNTCIMCCECQYLGLDVGFNLQYPGRTTQAHTVWQGAETAFMFFDWFFGLVFLLELIVKVACWRWSYFYDTESWDLKDEEEIYCDHPCFRCLCSVQTWNLLDFSCVLAFIFDKVASVGSVNPYMLRLLRLFRLFRLVRLLRFMESLDHLYIMTTAIAHLSKVLSWATILLTTMLLTCDLFLVQILQATYFANLNASDLNEDQLRKHHQMYEYFGTCTRCMLSMYEITLGNWPPVARLLSEEVSEWFTLVCLAHKLTVGFAVVGVITGVILQETFSVAQTDDVIMSRSKKLASTTLRKKLKTFFEALDPNGDGQLDEAEFMAIEDSPEMLQWLASLDIETDDLKTLFSLNDVDGSGYITLDELVARMPRIKGGARGIDVLAMRNNPSFSTRESGNSC